MKDRAGRDMTTNTASRLRALAHPITGELLSDFERINGFVRVGNDAADALDLLYSYWDNNARCFRGTSDADAEKINAAFAGEPVRA